VKLPAALEFESLHHGYDGHTVIHGISLQLQDQVITSLLGPSGCGKTTLLRLAAGLEKAWNGTIRLRGRDADSQSQFLPAEKRKVGLVFQDFALFPHLTVLENVLFGVEKRRSAEAEAAARAMLARVGLSEKAGVYPHTLSGGQQQRVALARALAPGPDLLLLDEPFSGLDTVLRRSVYQELRDILEDTGVAALIVTHDPEEAMILSHRIVLMCEGRIEQEGTPEELYSRPATPFAMRFMGETNVLPTQVEDGHAMTALGRFPLPEDGGGKGLQLFCRPEALHVSKELNGGGQTARVESRIFTGRATRLYLRLADGTRVQAHLHRDVPVHEGDEVRVNLDEADAYLLND